MNSTTKKRLHSDANAPSPPACFPSPAPPVPPASQPKRRAIQHDTHVPVAEYTRRRDEAARAHEEARLALEGTRTSSEGGARGAEVAWANFDATWNALSIASKEMSDAIDAEASPPKVGDLVASADGVGLVGVAWVHEIKEHTGTAVVATEEGTWEVPFDSLRHDDGAPLPLRYCLHPHYDASDGRVERHSLHARVAVDAIIFTGARDSEARIRSTELQDGRLVSRATRCTCASHTACECGRSSRLFDVDLASLRGYDDASD